MAAVLAADVVGYSRMMAVDEAGTHARLKSLLEDFIEPSVSEHRGRVVKLMGDGVLVEFGSVIDAVECAVALQTGILQRQGHESDDRRFAFRIGINIGDIIKDGEDIFGDGVNIAARLEGLADPGGILISGTAFDQAKSKIQAGFEYLGEQSVKNIPEPIRTYRVLLDQDAIGTVTAHPGSKRRLLPSIPLTIAAAVLVLFLGSLMWWLKPWAAREEPASVARMALALPDKPSIAVLPFDNLSANSEREYFSDGLTEDVIAALSRIPDLFVISRNSTFAYKSKPVTIQAVAEELGVHYVLEGSVQFAEDGRLRVTAQLIDALTGFHVWTGRFDRTSEDLFAIKDEISLNVVSNLQLKLSEGEMVRVKKRYTNNLEAWLLYYEGRDYAFRIDNESNQIAKEILTKSLEIDPNFVPSIALLGRRYVNDGRFKWSESIDASFEQAKALAERALEIDDQIADVHQLLMAYHLFYKRDHDEAIVHAERAVNVDPNNSIARFDLGYAYMKSGQPKKAIPELQIAMRLSPQFPDFFLENLGEAFLMAEQCDEAEKAYFRVIDRKAKSPTILGESHMGLALCLARDDKTDEARLQIKKATEINPRFTVSYLREWLIYRDQDYLNWYLTTVEELGLPK
ncbi:MAG: tetratricopeptide repeat protein [Alphaproteobacteria bacterium]|nr:tetratricopeptide repeat protein [Alphaproteobacteria bacterium]